MKTRTITQRTLGLALAFILTTALVSAAWTYPILGASQKKIDSKIKVMTWNLYQGADLSPLFGAQSLPALFAAVGQAYGRIQATNFPERAESIAASVEETSPDFIGLEEAILLRTQFPSDGLNSPATVVTYDYIQILLDKLAARGLNYHLVISQTNADLEVPGILTSGITDIRLTDRDALLVRDGLKGIALSNAQGAQYLAKLIVPSLLGSIAIPRSWVSVDVTFAEGNELRLVATHLEPISPAVQVAQAGELLNGPGNTALPVVFIGDFNSKADGSGTLTYSNLIAAGLSDSWNALGVGSGFTCCQNADLLNAGSALNERIDLILFKGNFKVQEITVQGEQIGDKTTSGLWPSDHAGVVAKLKLTTTA